MRVASKKHARHNPGRRIHPPSLFDESSAPLVSPGTPTHPHGGLLYIRIVSETCSLVFCSQPWSDAFSPREACTHEFNWRWLGFEPGLHLSALNFGESKRAFARGGKLLPLPGCAHDS
jgi:hypothetical protein